MLPVMELVWQVLLMIPHTYKGVMFNNGLAAMVLVDVVWCLLMGLGCIPVVANLFAYLQSLRPTRDA